MVAQSPNTPPDRPLPGIEGLALGLRWVEDILTTVSGPLIQLGLGLSVIDTLSNGQFAANLPQLTMIYAVALTVGIDGQLVGSAFRLSRAGKYKQWGEFCLELAIVAVLGYITYIGGWAAGYKETFNTSTTAALAFLGFDKLTWLAQRIGVAVLLAILSGVRRYVEPKPEKSASEIEANLARQAAIASAKAKYGAQVWNARRAALAAVATGQDIEEPEAEPAEDTPEALPDNVTTLKPKRGKGRKRTTRKVTDTASAQRLMRDFLIANPTKTSNNAIASATGLSSSTVSKHKAAIMAQLGMPQAANQ